jgi:hypothetical protein
VLEIRVRDSIFGMVQELKELIPSGIDPIWNDARQ